MRTPNQFDTIYKAAIIQDPDQLPEKGTYDIDEWRQGIYGLSAAAQLAFEGNQKAVEWLIQQGAKINWAAQGFARGGHTEQAITCVKKASADIDWVVQGFAQGGHTKQVIACVEKHGANITWVAEGFAKGSLFRLEKQQLAVFSQLTIPNLRSALIQGLQEMDIKIAPETIKKSEKMQRLMQTYGFTFRQALFSINMVIKTEEAIVEKKKPSFLDRFNIFQSQQKTKEPHLLSVLTSLFLYGSQSKFFLPFDLWHSIFEYVTESTFTKAELEELIFLTVRLMVLSQLPEKENKSRENILATQDFKTLASVVAQQEDPKFSVWNRRLAPYQNQNMEVEEADEQSNKNSSSVNDNFTKP